MLSLPKFARRWLRRPLRTLPSLDAYALWAANYPPQAHNPLMEIEQAAMLELLPPLDGRVVLDLACGTGRYGLIAQGRGAAQVIGLDNSLPMLVGSPLRGRGQATSESVPLKSACIDVVLCGLALGHLPSVDASMREIGRVLKPGGAALVSDVHPFIALNGAQRTFAAPGGRVYAVEHYAHLYADMHRAAAAAGLAVEALREPTHAGAPVVIVYRFIRA